MSQIVMQLHVANGAQAIEPGVGNLFHQLGEAHSLHSFDQSLPLPLHSGIEAIAIDLHHRTSNLDITDLVIAFDAKLGGALCDGCDECPAGCWCVVLEIGGVHYGVTRLTGHWPKLWLARSQAPAWECSMKLQLQEPYREA